MRFISSLRLGGFWPRGGALLVEVGSLVGLLAGASCSTSSTSPSPPALSGPFLGTWAGAITSDVIGSGTATLVLDAQLGSDSYPLLSGTWALSFPNSLFSTRGPIVANLNPERTILGVTFDRASVPCPGEPGGSAQQTMFSSMTVSGNRMRGRYIAGGCPGGAMELTRK